MDLRKSLGMRIKSLFEITLLSPEISVVKKVSKTLFN